MGGGFSYFWHQCDPIYSNWDELSGLMLKRIADDEGNHCGYQSTYRDWVEADLCGRLLTYLSELLLQLTHPGLSSQNEVQLAFHFVNDGLHKYLTTDRLVCNYCVGIHKLNLALSAQPAQHGRYARFYDHSFICWC